MAHRTTSPLPVARPSPHRRSRSTEASLLVAGGTAAALLTWWLVARSPILRQPEGTAIVRGLVVASYVAVGVYTWWRRPRSRLGPLIAGVGFLFAATSLDAVDSPFAYSLGRVLLAGFLVYLMYVFLCFPRDRLGSAQERRFIKAAALLSLVAWAAAIALSETLPPAGVLAECDGPCPHNAFQLVSSPAAVERLIEAVVIWSSVLIFLGTVALLARKLRQPSRLRRRAITPLLYTFVVFVLIQVAQVLLVRVVDVGGGDALRAILAVAALAIPSGLIVGQVRGRVFAATSLGMVAARASAEPLDTARVQSLVGEALGDPMLMLVLWVPEQGSYVDVLGAPIDLSTVLPERTVTPIVRDGQPLAAMIHDPALDADAGVVEGLAGTTLMLLENTRLVEELRASRARIVEAAEHERIRLERDLHDGAQQRLMGIQVKLALVQERVDRDDLAEQLEEIRADAAGAVEELRILAHGIYPTILVERGLRDALRSVALTAPIPIEVVDGGIGRCPATIEAAVYFCSVEAIQNAVKHAGPGARVSVAFGRRDGEIAFEIRDDGSGMEPPAAGGMGLTSMRDRIGAVGGELEIVSAPGAGTRVRGTIPTGSGPSPADDHGGHHP
jgi:signal transduction histidine kinase